MATKAIQAVHNYFRCCWGYCQLWGLASASWIRVLEGARRVSWGLRCHSHGLGRGGEGLFWNLEGLRGARRGWEGALSWKK